MPMKGVSARVSDKCQAQRLNTKEYFSIRPASHLIYSHFSSTDKVLTVMENLEILGHFRAVISRHWNCFSEYNCNFHLNLFCLLIDSKFFFFGF